MKSLVYILICTVLLFTSIKASNKYAKIASMILFVLLVVPIVIQIIEVIID
ncbi:hypothetical protein JYU01_02330 [bacterium AH-315-L21]|nr:hypothetical protein [bacterium AH-315-L21]